ncbi:MAG: hypothetical protein ACR2OM_00835, partial [Aestuariivirgaceae bacterium]
MAWLRISLLVVVFGLAEAGLAMWSHAAEKPVQTIEFHGIRLGMTEDQACTHIDRIAPGAMVGALCSDNKRGVGSYLNYAG